MNQLSKTLKDNGLARWSALIFISLVMFAGYYYYDVFSSVVSTLRAELNLTNTEYGIWYGRYSLLNAFGMVFIGGIILDRWGIRKTGALFITFMFLGTFGIAYGASETFRAGGAGHEFFGSFWTKFTPEFKMMLFGRILLGLGSETFWVTINKIVAKWFKGKELALAFAISLAFGRFGTAAALMISPRIVENTGTVSAAGWLGFVFVAIAVVMFIIFSVMDFRYDKQLGKKNTEDGIVEESQALKFSDIVSLLTNRPFLYITLLCLTFYSAVFPFLAFAADFLANKFGFDQKLSGDLVSILPYGTIIFTPVFGFICDRYGKSASLMIFGSLILIGVYLAFSFTSVVPYVPLFFLGVAFSLIPAAMWPSVANIIDAKKLGTAYGFMFFIQNWGLMLIPQLMGFVLDKTNPNVTAELVTAKQASYDYKYTLLLLIGLGILGLVFAFLLKREDKIKGLGLELPNKDKN